MKVKPLAVLLLLRRVVLRLVSISSTTSATLVSSSWTLCPLTLSAASRNILLIREGAFLSPQQMSVAEAPHSPVHIITYYLAGYFFLLQGNKKERKGKRLLGERSPLTTAQHSASKKVTPSLGSSHKETLTQTGSTTQSLLL